MTKRLTCPKGPSHKLFYRQMVVQGVAKETRDAQDQPLDVEDPEELTLVKRITGVVCAMCGATANIRLPF